MKEFAIFYIDEMLHFIPSDIIQQVASFSLTIFGIGLTIFTVLYSFILNKKDLVNELEQVIPRSTKEDPVLKIRYLISKRYIERQKRINVHIGVLSIISFLNFLLYLVTIMIDCRWVKFCFVLNSVVMVFYFIISLLFFLVSYKKETR